MSIKAHLLTKLLRLYPNQLTRESFEIESRLQTDVIQEVVKEFTEDSLIQYSAENFFRTKQHIYIFKLDKNYSVRHFTSKNFPFNIHAENTIDGVKCFFFYCEVTYKLTISNPIEEIEITFLQPACLSFYKDYACIHFTMLEKDMTAYIEKGRKIYEEDKINSEDALLMQIYAFVSDYFDMERADITKGIKFLLDKGILDLKYVKFRKSKSTSTETMDEEFTVKAQYPDVFDKVMEGPLNNTVLKYMVKDDKLCKHFRSDPTVGLVVIPIFTDNDEQIINVLAKILSNN